VFLRVSVCFLLTLYYNCPESLATPATDMQHIGCALHGFTKLDSTRTWKWNRNKLQHSFETEFKRCCTLRKQEIIISQLMQLWHVQLAISLQQRVQGLILKQKYRKKKASCCVSCLYVLYPCLHVCRICLVVSLRWECHVCHCIQLTHQPIPLLGLHNASAAPALVGLLPMLKKKKMMTTAMVRLLQQQTYSATSKASIPWRHAIQKRSRHATDLVFRNTPKPMPKNIHRASKEDRMDKLWRRPNWIYKVHTAVDSRSQPAQYSCPVLASAKQRTRQDITIKHTA
jgi:hypothetical protein